MFNILSYLLFFTYVFLSLQFGFKPFQEASPKFPIEAMIDFSIKRCPSSCVYEITENLYRERSFQDKKELFSFLFLKAAEMDNSDAYWSLAQLHMPDLKRGGALLPRYKAKYYFYISKYLRVKCKDNQTMEQKEDLFDIQEYMMKGIPLSPKDEERAIIEFQKWKKSRENE